MTAPSRPPALDAEEPTHDVPRGGTWAARRGLALPALLLGACMLVSGVVPNGIGQLGSLVQTFLPWTGLAVPGLVVLALWRRSAWGMAALLVPVAVWSVLFGGRLVDKTGPDGDLVVAEHNVGAGNPDPAGTARALAGSGADVLALVEVTEQARPVYERALSASYPYYAVRGTVGLWSRLPLSGVVPLDLRMDAGPLAASLPARVRAVSARALRATVATAHGPLAVYVAHLASVRVDLRSGFGTEQRNRGVQALAEAVAAEPVERVVLLGDLNGSTDDRALAPLTDQLESAQDSAGDGFGFTWPARFPVLRIDEILVRHVRPARSSVLPPTGSDHRPVVATIMW